MDVLFEKKWVKTLFFDKINDFTMHNNCNLKKKCFRIYFFSRKPIYSLHFSVHDFFIKSFQSFNRFMYKFQL